MPINTVQDLRAHLAVAIEVELTTIPPYLYALYSIEDQGAEAAMLIRSIVVEEMLHVSLASNLLVAVGGEPTFGRSSAVPQYPCDLPHHKPRLPIHLAPCSLELVRDTLMVLERPGEAGAPLQADEFESLGQFYYAMEEAIDRLDAGGTLFANPQRDRQLGDPAFYAPVEMDAEDSGGLMMIDDAASADAAIEIIVHQGEGLSDDRWADESHQELTHYYKLEQIALGTSPVGAVRPAMTDPSTALYPEAVRPVSDLFNALYRYTMLTLDALYQPSEDKGPLIDRLYGLMSGALAPVGRYLMELPLGDGMVAGPTFEVFEFSDEPLRELRSMVAALSEAHPSIASIAGLFAEG
ncbi:MAG: ferritin-like protein [Chloroflexi bacterium]|nr:ferritin-like protein [Chloroflexota bacterium]MDA1147933.1 ferritin-like protein [Chloroflexota bacterium]